MSNVINKKTLVYLRSVHTPKTQYEDKDNWIINPVLPKCDNKYWKIDSDLVKEMTSEEKLVVDNKNIPTRIKSKNQIMTELWLHIAPNQEDTPEITGAKQERAVRFGNALKETPGIFMSLHLDNNDYTLARERAGELLAMNIIKQSDYDILDGILPK